MSREVVINGTSQPGVMIEVTGGPEREVTSSDSQGNFTLSVTLGRNRVNRLFVQAIRNGERGPITVIEIIHDEEAPFVFIDFPADGATVSNATLPVVGRIGDTLTGFISLSATVNNTLPTLVAPGVGTNGTFETISEVPLQLGTNLVRVFAEDAMGNRTYQQITVTRVEPTSIRMAEVGETRRIGRVLADLASPITVQLTNPDGEPIAGKLVTFDVTRSDGLLRGTETASPDSGSLQVQVATDATGHARVWWRLGSDSGCGNNRVEVRSEGVSGTAFFLASAEPMPVAQINIGTGNYQRAEAGGTPAEKLRAWVNDTINGVAGVPVTFTVTQGGGLVNGQPSITIDSAASGHADVVLTCGPETGNNVVEATFPGNRGLPATFVVYGSKRDPLQPTSFSGVVLDNANQPIVGVECRLIMRTTGWEGTAVTDANGAFTITGIEGAGPSDLYTEAWGDNPAFPNCDFCPVYPEMHFEPLIVPNAPNSIGMPILLPPLVSDWNAFTGDQDVVLEVPGIEGLRMTIKAGTVARRPNDDGTYTVASPSTPIHFSLNQVHTDNLPMPMPDGTAPSFAWTLQPGGTTFNPPVQIEYPNMDGAPPGSTTFFSSFNHDTFRFEIVSSASVSEDGSVLRSDAGQGIPTAGWGGRVAPPPPTGNAGSGPKPNGCGSETGLSQYLVPNCYPLLDICFTPSCNTHDICYGTLGSNKFDCDVNMWSDMRVQCSNAFPENSVSRSSCEVIADMYFLAVDLYGVEAFFSAQRDAAAAMGQDFENQNPGESGQTLVVDDDRDGVPDYYEIEIGMDPMDPLDAREDTDLDGYSTYDEIVFGFNPFDSDTDADGVSDSQEFFNLLESLRNLPPVGVNDSFNVTLDGQQITPSRNGSLIFRNARVSLDDGAGVTSCTRIAGSTLNGRSYLTSDFFQLRQNETVTIPNIRILDAPPLDIVSLTATPGASVLTSIGATTTVQLTPLMSDGIAYPGFENLEGGWELCNRWVSSNPAIASVAANADGTATVTARSAGVVFITATNNGATTVTRLRVAPGAALTRLEGVVLWNDTETAAASVRVAFPQDARSTQTSSAGAFAFADVPDNVFGQITLSATGYRNLQSHFGFKQVVPTSQPVTDVGFIRLAPLDRTDADGDGVPDMLEPIIGFDPTLPDTDGNSTLDGAQDTDNDAVPDWIEFLLGFDATIADTDGDGVPDRNEDTDGEGLTDLQEFNLGTDWLNIDTDGDYFTDFEENRDGTDPLNAMDTPLSRTSMFFSVLSTKPTYTETNSEIVTFSVLSTFPPPTNGFAISSNVSVLSTKSPDADSNQAISNPISISNEEQIP
jgi:hypothetical protein